MAAQNNINILVVDDEKQLLNALEEYITLFDYSCSTAKDGRLALEKLNQEHFDIVITDIQMPNMDGIQLLKQIKNHFPGVEVIVCTGYPDSYQIVEALNAGAIDYLTKPFPLKEIELKLKRVVREIKLVQKLNQELTISKTRQDELEMAYFTIDTASDAIYWVRADGRFAYANQSAARQLGYSPEELRQMSVFDIDPNFKTEDWQDHWQKLQKHGTLILEAIHRAKDGREFPVEISANYNQFNATAYNVAFSRDISNRKILEEQLVNANKNLAQEIHAKTISLQETVLALEDEIKKRNASELSLSRSEKLYRTLFEQAGDYIFILDLAHNPPIIIDANQSCCDIHGYKREELIGQTISLIEPKVHATEIPERIRKASLDQQIEFETTHVTKDGRIFPVEVKAKLIKLEDRTIALSIERDITARKKAEEKIINLSTRLGQSVEEERKKIAADLHDEFGQLLLTFNYNLDRIKQKISLDRDDGLQKNFTKLDTAFKQLGDCCRDITTRLRPPIFDDMGFIPTLEWTVKNFKETQPHKVEVTFKISAPIPAMSEYVKIVTYRVLQESLNNIAKHAKPRNVFITLKIENSEIVLTIKDDGRGFDPNLYNKDSNRRKGFGLQTMEERVSSIAGHLFIDSKSGAGTTIKALIPLNEPITN
ncbi:MAG: PAS domain S-box protein [Proteobacteria bacterium]|nr:PAS domain S-box protein [Pseudomonadota bacterium]MBU1715250.1 PAS domain S-box protein [Pseudomonadota bacterium]